MLTLGKFNSPPGFTVIELLVVVALFIVLTSLSIYLSFDMYRGYAWRTEQDVIVSALQKARAQSMANLCLGSCTDGKRHGVAILADKYVIFQGDSYAARDVSFDEAFDASPVVGHSPVNTEVVFERLSGATSGFNLTLTDPIRSTVISVNGVGRISW